MESWNLKYIGGTLKKLRKSKLQTQEDLAEESGLGTRTISSLENNHQEPLFSTIRSLAAALEMDTSEFMMEIEMDVQKAQVREKNQKRSHVQME